MTATAAEIALVRKMTAEPLTTTYLDADIAAAIERHPLVDNMGESPLVIDTATLAMVANTDWVATYDLNAAAADIWELKLAAIADKFDYSAEGSDFKLSQMVNHYGEMAAMYNRRRNKRRVQVTANWPEGE